jgi:PAS domain S-box-containing protein
MTDSDKIDLQLVSQLFKISNQTVSSFHDGGESKSWQQVTAGLRDFFDCELATLWLVDPNDPDYLVLASQTPAVTDLNRPFRLEIKSDRGAGLTGHVAATKQAVSLNAGELSQSPWIRREPTPFLPSGECYSVLYVPLLNRKANLVGLLRFNNRNISKASEKTAFSAADMLLMQMLASHLTTVVEPLRQMDIFRKLSEEIQNAESVDQVLRLLIRAAMSLVQADNGAIAMPDREQSGLEWKMVLGSGSGVVVDATVADEDLSEMWMQAQARSTYGAAIGSDDLVIRTNLPTGTFELPAAASSANLLLRSNQRPLGILVLESTDLNWFDDIDANWLSRLLDTAQTSVNSIRSSLVRQTLQTLTDTRDRHEALMESIVHNIPIVMWRKDLRGRYTWVNRPFCESQERSEKDIIGRTDRQLFGEKLARRYLDGDEAAMANGVYEDPYEPYYANGENRLIHVFKQAIYDQHDKVAGTQGVFFDVTADQYRTLFDRAPVGFHELDTQGRIRHINQTELEMLGLYGDNYEDIRGKPFADFVVVSDRHLIQSLFEAASSQPGTAQPLERGQMPINLLRPDGRSLPVLMSTQTIRSAEGQPNGIVCAVSEIRAGSEIEASLREPNEEYLQQLQKLPLSVFCLDADLKVSDANDEYQKRELSGRSIWSILGRTSTEIYGRTLGEQYDRDNQRVIKEGLVLDKVELHPDSNRPGTQKIVRVLKFPLRGANGSATGVQCVFWNYEENDSALELLRQAYLQSLISHSVKARESMLRMLSHQLRSPIWQTFERTNDYVETLDDRGQLARGEAGPELRQVAVIRGLARKARRVAWSIDMLWRLAESSNVQIRRESQFPPRTLLRLAREAAQDMQLIMRVGSQQSERRVPGVAPDFRAEIIEPYWLHKKVRGDQSLIEQAVGNLVDNAFKYSVRDSEIQIQCRIDFEKVVLAVRNRSPKALRVDADVVENCRSKDWRAPAAAAIDADGTGLGLWLVDRIMKAHGGRLLVKETDADGWNEFGIEFPL